MTGTAKFHPADYTTARGHQLAVGDHVVVMTPQRRVSPDVVVVELLPRQVGEVANVRVRDENRRAAVVNAFCVEPDGLETTHRRRSCACGMALVSTLGKPYTGLDDVDGDGVCQWCRNLAVSA